MRLRRSVITTVALSLVLAGTLAAPVSAVKPPPLLAASLTDDGSCLFTLEASWSGGVKVKSVIGQWFLDSIAFENHLFTTVAPGTGPNGGTVKGRTSTNVAGPLAADTSAHDFIVLVQFYSEADGGGAQLGQVEVRDTASCTRFSP